MSALFCEQQDVGRMKYTKNVLMRSLILFAAIYQMHAVLNLLIIHEKQKIKKIILLLVKQNRKLKNSELEGSKDKKKKFTWFKQGRTDEWWKNMLSGDSDENDWKKNFRMSRELFHELLDHLVSDISPNIYRLIEE